MGRGTSFSKVCIRGRCLLGVVLLTSTLIGCGSEGVSQEEYDRVVAERDELREQSRTNENTLSHFKGCVTTALFHFNLVQIQYRTVLQLL